SLWRSFVTCTRVRSVSRRKSPPRCQSTTLRTFMRNVRPNNLSVLRRQRKKEQSLVHPLPKGRRVDGFQICSEKHEDETWFPATNGVPFGTKSWGESSSLKSATSLRPARNLQLADPISQSGTLHPQSSRSTVGATGYPVRFLQGAQHVFTLHLFQSAEIAASNLRRLLLQFLQGSTERS